MDHWGSPDHIIFVYLFYHRQVEFAEKSEYLCQNRFQLYVQYKANFKLHDNVSSDRSSQSHEGSSWCRGYNGRKGKCVFLTDLGAIELIWVSVTQVVFLSVVSVFDVFRWWRSSTRDVLAEERTRAHIQRSIQHHTWKQVLHAHHKSRHHGRLGQLQRLRA